MSERQDRLQYVRSSQKNYYLLPIDKKQISQTDIMQLFVIPIIHYIMIEQGIKKDLDTQTIDSTYTKPMTLTNQSFPGKKVLTRLAVYFARTVRLRQHHPVHAYTALQACISNLNMYLFFTTYVYFHYQQY